MSGASKGQAEMLHVGVTTIRPGNHLELNGEIFEVTNYEHVKPGKGGALVRLKLKSMETGASLDKTYDGSAKVSRVEVTAHPAQFLFKSGEACTFMNLETYDQLELPISLLKRQAGFLKESLEVTLLDCEGTILGVKFPTTVELKIVETPPGVKGDTVSRSTKQATLETGVVVHVPLFLATGDVIRLDTRSGEYVGRV